MVQPWKKKKKKKSSSLSYPHGHEMPGLSFLSPGKQHRLPAPIPAWSSTNNVQSAIYFLEEFAVVQEDLKSWISRYEFPTQIAHQPHYTPLSLIVASCQCNYRIVNKTKQTSLCEAESLCTTQWLCHMGSGSINSTLIKSKSKQNSLILQSKNSSVYWATVALTSWRAQPKTFKEWAQQKARFCTVQCTLSWQMELLWRYSFMV